MHKELVKISFDGLGWGGWAIENGKLKFDTAEIIAKILQRSTSFMGWGWQTEDIVRCVGWDTQYLIVYCPPVMHGTDDFMFTMLLQ